MAKLAFSCPHLLPHRWAVGARHGQQTQPRLGDTCLEDISTRSGNTCEAQTGTNLCDNARRTRLSTAKRLRNSSWNNKDTHKVHRLTTGGQVGRVLVECWSSVGGPLVQPGRAGNPVFCGGLMSWSSVWGGPWSSVGRVLVECVGALNSSIFHKKAAS